MEAELQIAGARVPLKAVVADARAQSDTWDSFLETPPHPMLAISTCSFSQRRDRMGVVLAALVGVPWRRTPCLYDKSCGLLEDFTISGTGRSEMNLVTADRRSDKVISVEMRSMAICPRCVSCQRGIVWGLRGC